MLWVVDVLHVWVLRPPVVEPSGPVVQETLMRYLLRLQGGPTTQRWETSFDMSSDRMAQDFARRVLVHDPCVRGATGAVLYNMEPEQDYIVASWRIEHLTAVTLDANT